MKIRTYLAKDEAEASKIKRRVRGLVEHFEVIIAPEKIDLFQRMESDYISDKITQYDYYTKLAAENCLLTEDGEHYVRIPLEDWHQRLLADNSLFPESLGLREAMLQIIDNHINGVKAS